MPIAGQVLAAEKEDVSSPGVFTLQVPLHVDAKGNLYTTIGGSAVSAAGGHTLVLIKDEGSEQIALDTLYTMRAILNHMRVLTTNAVVDETAPL